MPRTSATTAPNTQDYGIALEHTEDLDDYTVNFVSIREDQDLAPMLASLPTGRCECPHWGFVQSGRISFTYPDRVEVYEAGDAFYTPPGHTPAAEKGAEFVLFSPAEQLKATEDAIRAGLQANA